MSTSHRQIATISNPHKTGRPIHTRIPQRDRYDGAPVINRPKIAYGEAERLCFALDNTEVVTVREASVESFTAFATALLLQVPATRTKNVHLELVGLDYSRMLDKWYALNELLSAGVVLPEV